MLDYPQNRGGVRFSMPDSKQQISRFIAIFASGTLLSRVLGLVRDAVLGALIPPSSLGLFWAGFKLPNTLRDLLGEGAMNAAFLPTFAEAKETLSDKEYRSTVAAVYSAMWIVFLVVTLMGILAASYAPHLLNALDAFTGKRQNEHDPATIVLMIQWCFPYIFFIGLGVFCMAPLFVARHYSTPSWTPVLLNVSLIACCVFLRHKFEEPAWALVVGVWLGGILQMAVLTWAMRRHAGVTWPSFQLRHPAIRRCAYLLAPVAIGQSAGPINKLVNTFLAVSLGGSTVTALTYANNLVQLPLSIFGVAVSVAILPSISRAGARGEMDVVRSTLIHGLRQSFYLVMPAMAVLLVLAEPIVRLLFERGQFTPETTAQTAVATLYYGTGLLAFAWVKVCVQGFYALKDTKTPVIAAAASMLLNIALNFALVGPMGFRGLALATTIAFILNFVLLYILLCRRYGRLWDAPMLFALTRMTLACILAAVAAWAGLWAVHQYAATHTAFVKLLAVALPGGLALATYITASHLLRLDEFRTLLSAIRRRKAPPIEALDPTDSAP